MTVRRPTVAGRDLGSELREIREERGLSMREVARRLDWPVSKLSKIETGKQGTKREDVASLLAIYGITGQRRDYLVNKAGKVDKPGHWEKSGLDGGLSRETRTLIRLERDAIQIQSVEPLLIPGLLQLPEYTRALMKACGVPEQDIEVRVAARLSRQAILSREPGPAFQAFLDESALRRPVLPPKLMARQLRHLVETAERPNVTLRALPFSLGAHNGLDGSFMLLDLPEQKSVVLLEHKICALFLEDEEEIKFFRKEVERLNEVALTHVDSINLIAQIAKELEE